MKWYENILVGIIIIFLSLHLFTVHSKLLFHINPDKLVKTLTYIFNSTLFDQELIVSTIGAIAYSLITALILTIFVKYRIVFIITASSFALLDGIGVFVYYNVTIGEKLFLILGAIYYAVYTASIIVSLGLFRYLGYSEVSHIGIDTDISGHINNAISELNLKETIQEIFDENKNIQEKNTANNPDEVLIEKVLFLLNEKKLTQVEVADICRISQTQVSRIYNKNKDE